MAQIAATNGFKPSAYQENIFGFVKDKNSRQPHGIVNAVAGAGKTTTLEHAAKLIEVPGMFCAFNKHIADTLATRLTGTAMVASTIHSLGMRTLYGKLQKRPHVDEGKYWSIVRDFAKRYARDFEGIPHAVPQLVKICRFVRLTLTPVTDRIALETMAARYGLEIDEKFFPMIPRLLNIGLAQAENEGVIDFTDMLWLPHILHLQPHRYGWLFVDECQDLNRAQLELALKCLAPGGRSLWVGDPFQSIMAFSGADSRSYHAIRERTNAKELPLSICYRCPTEVLKIARELVPHIEARPGAPAGVVRQIDTTALIDQARERDLIMCRRNAPLVKQCLRMVRLGMNARMRGRDIGKELADLVREIGKNGRYDSFPYSVSRYQAIQMSMLEARGAGDAQMEALADRCEAILECYAGFSECRSAEQMATKLESIFVDVGSAIWFSSIHRAKGLEAERTFILDFAKLGETRNRQASDEDAMQERNLRYVAVTRSLHTMHVL